MVFGGGRVPGAETDAVEQALRDALAPLVSAHEGTVAAAVRHLETGAAYAHDADRDSNTLEVFIGRLRRKLPPDSIETVRGLGYRLVVPS